MVANFEKALTDAPPISVTSIKEKKVLVTSFLYGNGKGGCIRHSLL